MNLKREIELASHWMLEAEAILRPYMADAAKRAAAVGSKGTGEVVTAADHAISNYLIERISGAFRGDAVCSEENLDLDNPKAVRRWIIDPIDGTRSFVRGIPGYSVMLALAVEGRPVLGVVHDPEAGNTWIAAKGLGVWRNHEAIRPVTAPPGLIWSPFASPEGRAAIADGLGVERVLEIESFGLRATIMAQGGGGICGSRPGSPHVWDSAAGVVIIGEVGGIVTDYRGEALAYTGATVHDQGMVASLGVDHTRARELFRRHLP